MTSILDAPVGLRWRVTNVRNFQVDQETVIGLLARIPVSQGGQKENWPAPILAGGDGQCVKTLADAIWSFQSFWKAKGVFHNIDGVVDPNQNTIKQLDRLAGGSPGPVPPPPQPDPIVRPPRQPGTWQITNMWSLNVGEVGLLGAVEMEITQPDEKKFVMKGAGAGIGVSVDPIGWLKAMKGLASLNPFSSTDPVKLVAIIEMLAKGVGFSIGDYLSIFTNALGPLSVTGGRIIPNPANSLRNRPNSVSRQMLAGGGVPPPFIIVSAGGAFGAGMEGGVVLFDSFPGPFMLDCAAIGVYGSSGVNLKVGAGAQYMQFHNRGAKDVIPT